MKSILDNILYLRSNNISDLIYDIKKVLLSEINAILLLDFKSNEYTEFVIIDGIDRIELYNNVSLFGSKPRNILFLGDTHHLKNTKNIDLFYEKIIKLNIFIIKNINNFFNINITDNNDNEKIKYIRNLISFVNDNLYFPLTKDLYKKNLISIDQLLYFNSMKSNECLDIFIENYAINFDRLESIYCFLTITNNIFFNCGNKIIYDTKEDKIIDDSNITNIEISKNYSNRICNFNIRYQRSDIRNISYTIINDIYYKNEEKLDNSIKKDFDTFKLILDAYIEYLFNIDIDIDILSTSFYELHLKNYENFSYYEKLIKYYTLSKNIIKKQYGKSIFKNINIENLKEYIKLTQHKIGIINSTMELDFTNDKFNDIFNIELTAITMNLYSIFRMFIDNWHEDPNKKIKFNLSEGCNNLEYPKNIIYFAGNYHNHWIIQFINICVEKNSQNKFENTISIHAENNNNFILLDYISYIKLKKFFTIIDINIDFKYILDYNLLALLYNEKYINILDTYFKVKSYNNFEIIIKDIINIYKILKDNSYINFFYYKNIKNKLFIYLKYIEKIYKYIKDTDIQVYKGNTLDNDDKSDEIENKIENKDEDEDIIINKNLSYIENREGIKFYCDLLKMIINNSIIISTYLINLYNDKEIDSYYISENNIDYDSILYYYNLNSYLNYYISTPENVLKYYKYYIDKNNIFINIDDKHIINEFEIDDIYKNIKNIYYKIIQFYNKENIDLLNIDEHDIIRYLKLFNFTVNNLENIQNISYYYYLNLYIFSSNIVLILCYYFSKKYNISCKYDKSISEDKLIEYLQKGINISKLYLSN